MIKLIFIIIILLSISFLCSILESVIFSLTRPYIQLLIANKNRTGNILKKLKDNIDEPITAILTLNTISHTIGATISGAFALQIFGSKWMALFTAILTLLILIFSEIIPKTIGAYYWKRLSPTTAYILNGLIYILKPVIIPMNFLSKLISGKGTSGKISKGEMINFIKLGHRQGIISSHEFKFVDNIINLDNIIIKNIMTPRTVVYWLSPEKKIKDIINEGIHLEFSRIPLYNIDKNTIEGIVLRRDIMNLVAEKKTVKKINTISRPPLFIIETASVYKLLDILITEKKQFAVVLDEYGDYVGIVTIEDAVETLLGIEIVDEYDKVADMNKLARLKSLKDKNLRKQ